MARKVRVNDLLTRRMLPELADFMKVSTRHEDRLTREEARATLKWAATNPDVVAAFHDPGHRAHSMVRLYKELVEHYAFRHPADPAGAPQPWPDRPASAHRPTEADPFAGMSRDEAEALTTWAEAHPDYHAAMTDPKHAQHRDYVDQLAALNRIMAEGTASPEPGAAEARPGGDHSAVQALQADAHFMNAYMDRRHPGHAAAVERMAAAYSLAHPEPVETAPAGHARADNGPAGVAAHALPRHELPRAQAAAQALRNVPGVRPDGRVAQVEIARLRADPAYANKSDSRHAEAVQAVTAAYQAAFPEPAQGDGNAA